MTTSARLSPDWGRASEGKLGILMPSGRRFSFHEGTIRPVSGFISAAYRSSRVLSSDFVARDRVHAVAARGPHIKDGMEGTWK